MGWQSFTCVFLCDRLTAEDLLSVFESGELGSEEDDDDDFEDDPRPEYRQKEKCRNADTIEDCSYGYSCNFRHYRTKEVVRGSKKDDLLEKLNNEASSIARAGGGYLSYTDVMSDAINDVCGKYGKEVVVSDEPYEICRLINSKDASMILTNYAKAEDGIQWSLEYFDSYLRTKLTELEERIQLDKERFFDDDDDDFGGYDDYGGYGGGGRSGGGGNMRKKAKTDASHVLSMLKAGALSLRPMSLTDRITRLERAVKEHNEGSFNVRYLEEVLHEARRANGIESGKSKSPVQQIINMLRALVADDVAREAEEATAGGGGGGEGGKEGVDEDKKPVLDRVVLCHQLVI